MDFMEIIVRTIERKPESRTAPIAVRVFTTALPAVIPELFKIRWLVLRNMLGSDTLFSVM